MTRDGVSRLRTNLCDLPNKKSGTCPVGTIPVYRLGNQRVDSNHRYTTSAAIRTQTLDAGL